MEPATTCSVRRLRTGREVVERYCDANMKLASGAEGRGGRLRHGPTPTNEFFFFTLALSVSRGRTVGPAHKENPDSAHCLSNGRFAAVEHQPPSGGELEFQPSVDWHVAVADGEKPLIEKPVYFKETYPKKMQHAVDVAKEREKL
ncbi:hypothetical protein EJ110_NYTH36994 [Nymphaea thermarum]|nr:hypothetical protein EJ110_NYTH36994 [Nymphaea thermarum]